MASTTEDERLALKRKFHHELNSLDRSDDETDDGLRESVTALKRHARRTPLHSNHKITQTLSARQLIAENTGSKDRRSLPRSVSDVGPSPSKQAAAASALRDLKSDTTDLMSTRKTFSGAVAPISSMPLVAGKRKRDSTINPIPIPKEQQIFDGLHFYFFPNNEKHPARLMRINKAIAFGATWQRDWGERVTHVVLDKAMDYAMLLKFVRKESLPAGIVVVNESWPSECIAYRALLDFTKPQFKVIGAPVAAAPPPTAVPASSADSDTSLKLKPAGKDVITRQPETQTSDENATHNAVVPGTTVTAKAPVEEARSTDVGNSAELDAAISQARDLQMMPLDDEDPGSRPSSSDGASMHQVPAPLSGQSSSKRQALQGKFQCMQKHTGEVKNTANSATIAILQQMADYYGQMGDEWRIRAYRKAIATLRNHPTKVCTKEEALALPNVGDRLATKIEEIAFTNRLQRLDSALAEPQDRILQTFMKVYGAGFVQASNWVRQGFTTLDEVLQKADLTDNQRLGIEHFADFQARIPRAEVTQHGAIVRKALHTLDPAFQLTIGGSYRRGAQDSGDIDFIITRPDTDLSHIRSVVLDRLIPALFAQDFLKAALAVSSADDGSKWHGACCLPGQTAWRRVDFLLVPWAEMGAALIYFTGNDIFNRSLRLLASTKGYRLNQRGLYKDVIRGKGRERMTEGTLVEGRDERRIFELLGVPWRPPEHRVP